jgi:hypothetical protein
MHSSSELQSHPLLEEKLPSSIFRIPAFALSFVRIARLVLSLRHFSLPL